MAGVEDHAARIDRLIGHGFAVREVGVEQTATGERVALEVTDEFGRQEVLLLPSEALDDPQFDDAAWLRRQMMQVHP